MSSHLHVLFQVSAAAGCIPSSHQPSLSWACCSVKPMPINCATFLSKLTIGGYLFCNHSCMPCMQYGTYTHTHIYIYNIHILHMCKYIYVYTYKLCLWLYMYTYVYICKHDFTCMFLYIHTRIHAMTWQNINQYVDMCLQKHRPRCSDDCSDRGGAKGAAGTGSGSAMDLATGRFHGDLPMAYGWCLWLPSGKRFHNCGKSQFVRGKSSIYTWTIFNSYVKIPEVSMVMYGNSWWI